MGVIPTVAPYLLPKALPAIHQRYPQLQMQLHEDLTPRLLTLLSHGKLDLLLLALGADLGDVVSLPLASDPSSPIIIRPFQKPEPSRTIGLVWRTTSAREHEFRLLAKLLVV